MARQLGPTLLGMEVEAIYHTSIIVFGKEHFFGGGIVSVPHEEFLATYHMQPFQVRGGAGVCASDAWSWMDW